MNATRAPMRVADRGTPRDAAADSIGGGGDRRQAAERGPVRCSSGRSRARWSETPSRWLGLLAGVTLGLCGLAAGCGDSSGVGGRPGGGTPSGQPQPACGALNQICLAAGLDAPLALGSQVELILDFRVPGSGGPSVGIEVADPDVIVADGTVLHTVGEGMTGVLFALPEGPVMDFIHVWVAPADELRILAYSRQGDLLGRVQSQVTLLVGDEVLIAVEPFRGAQPLLGNFPLQRTISGDAAILVPDAVGGLYRLVARQPGEANVTLSGLGLTAAWAIEVLP